MELWCIAEGKEHKWPVQLYHQQPVKLWEFDSCYGWTVLSGTMLRTVCPGKTTWNVYSLCSGQSSLGTNVCSANCAIQLQQLAGYCDVSILRGSCLQSGKCSGVVLDSCLSCRIISARLSTSWLFWCLIYLYTFLHRKTVQTRSYLL